MTRRPIIALALLTALIFLPACEDPQSPDLSLGQRISDAATDSNAQLDVSSLTDFEWDSLYVFTPYTTREAIDSALGFPWNHDAVARIEMLDSFNLLVFVHDQQVVRFVEQSIIEPDFGPVAEGSPWRPGEAFGLREVEYGGQRWLEVVPPASGASP